MYSLICHYNLILYNNLYLEIARAPTSTQMSTILYSKCTQWFIRLFPPGLYREYIFLFFRKHTFMFYDFRYKRYIWFYVLKSFKNHISYHQNSLGPIVLFEIIYSIIIRYESYSAIRYAQGCFGKCLMIGTYDCKYFRILIICKYILKFKMWIIILYYIMLFYFF